jgi:CheY-like chemotaxis protein
VRSFQFFCQSSMQKLVLLADDDADDSDIFKEALEEAACKVRFVRVETGAGVFEYLNDPKKQRPDIIFLDLNMPVMNGWQCLSKLKNALDFASIPVIMYTTSSHYRDLEIAKDLNAHGLITKPSNPGILVSVLKKILCSLGTNEFNQALKDAYLITQE